MTFSKDVRCGDLVRKYDEAKQARNTFEEPHLHWQRVWPVMVEWLTSPAASQPVQLLPDEGDNFVIFEKW